MRYVILLAVAAVASCAPVENAENEAIRVRRAKEIVMFGNVQNGGKDKVKRADEDVSGEADMNGYIASMEPQDIPAEGGEEQVPEEAELAEQAIEDAGENAENPDIPDEPVEELEPETLAPEEDAVNSEEIIETGQPEEETIETDNSEENADENNEVDFQKYYDDILPAYYYNLMSNSRPSQANLGYYDLYPFTRKRRSQERIFVGGSSNRARILKRSRRIKRDLIYPSETLDRDYLYGDEYPETNNNELVGYLLDLLDDKYNDEQPAYNVPYGGYEDPYEELEPYEEIEEPVDEFVYPGYEEQALENAIAKRQAGLTFVPGFKRNFYPAFEEPASHFGAFVKKRSQEDYANAYRRVMRLASALGQQDYYRYPEYEYRRK